MKLRAKLTLSYVGLIAIVFMIFYIVSMPLVRNYVKTRVSDSIEQEYVLVRSKIVDAMEDVSDRESYIKAIARERVAIERLGLSSSIGIFYYVKATGKFTFVQDITPDNETTAIMVSKITDKDTTSFQGVINGENHIMLISQIGINQNKQRVFLVLYSPFSVINSFTRGFTRIMVIVFGAVALVAVVLSFILAERMTNPIEKLKKQAFMLRNRNFKAKSKITTNDEFKELSDALNQAAAELESYNTAQKEFLDNISHELKTPLMSIQGYAEGIRDGIFSPDEKTLGIIVGESIRLKNLVGNISYLSKLESNPDYYKFTQINAGDILRNAVAAVSGLELARKTGIVLLASPDINLTGDREKLTQLFINILSNGLRYAKNSVIVEGIEENGFYVVKIKDDGPGLPKEDIERVFRRFYKGKGGNTGLGLAISMAIAKKHGGNITARNATPNGALFTVELPLVDKNT